MKKPIHILRYGTVAEKIHLEKAISAYDYLSINGNTAAYVSSAIAKFIVEKFFSKEDKGFFIDPITYAFQKEIHLLSTVSKNTGEKSIKKSIGKLIEVYGFPANKVLSGITVSISDFNNEEIKDEFCDKVLSFQYNLVYDHIKNNDLQKYIDYVVPNRSENIRQLRPAFIIAPYFYLDNNDPDWRKWIDLNVQLTRMSVSKSKEKFNNCEVFSQVVISRSVLTNTNDINTVINAYKDIDCSGYTIWIDNFSEHEVGIEELVGFIQLLHGLKGKTVYNMYGGFFSVLLSHKDIGLLSGVSHGLEYGESREVYPVGGGIPVSKYYFLPLHQRIDFTKAFYLLSYTNIIDTSKDNWGDSVRYYSEICKCRKCKSVIKDQMINFMGFESTEYYEIKRRNQVIRRKKASPETKENCLYHYLLCKKAEFSLIERKKLREILDDLINSKNVFSNSEGFRKDELDYLNNWSIVLDKYMKRI